MLGVRRASDRGVYRLTSWAVFVRWLVLVISLLLMMLVGVYVGTSGAYRDVIGRLENSFVGSWSAPQWILTRLSAIDAESAMHAPGLPSRVIGMQAAIYSKLEAMERDKMCGSFLVGSLDEKVQALSESMQRQAEAAEIIIRVNEGKCQP